MSDQTPHQLSDEVLADYVIKLKRCYDPVIAEAVILHHRPAAFLAANLICRRHPANRREDILSSAMLGLVQGTRWISEGRLENDQVTPWLVYCAYSFISKFIEFDRVIRIPHQSLLRQKLESAGEFEGIPCTLVSQMADGLDEERTKNMIVHPVAEDEAQCQELVQRIGKTPHQRNTLRLRMEGREWGEIGRIIGVNKQRMNHIKDELIRNYYYQKGAA